MASHNAESAPSRPTTGGSSSDESLSDTPNTGSSDSPSDAIDLLEENRRLQVFIMCIRCLKRRRCIVYIPCGHLLYCSVCDNLLYRRNCHMCNQFIRGSVHAEFSGIPNV